MMYIDDFWNVSNYAIPVKRNSCLNKNSIHLLIACSLESKWTCNSQNNLMYVDGFYPWQRISNVWIICEKKILEMIFYQNIIFLAICYDVSPTCIICTKVSDNLNPHVHVFWYCFTVCKYASTALES